MCGLLFLDQKNNKFSENSFVQALKLQSWRGPDNTSYLKLNKGNVILGHNRLSIIDQNSRSNQPFKSDDGRFLIIFNGEIYNYKDVKKELNLITKTESDTEVIIKGFEKIGDKILNYLDGMFAFIIYDLKKGSWFAARDHFGIKPLFIFTQDDITLIGSEPGIMANMIGSEIDNDSVQEWKMFRRPMPGYTFFKNIAEFPPATFLKSTKQKFEYYWKKPLTNNKDFNQSFFEEILKKSIRSHLIGDTRPVCLLSGGLDSSIITKFSHSVRNCYTVGLLGNNEFMEAKKTADELNKNLFKVEVSEAELIEAWKKLTKMRKEPLSVPNEGLIYLVCKKMNSNEKVVITGEGADELLFGYDRIFRWALSNDNFDLNKFLTLYSYSNKILLTQRLNEYIFELSIGKSLINFLEDFFIEFHLPGLLRRMDFASMAASKEARVPFISKNLFNYLYRKDSFLKIDKLHSKKPLRDLISKTKINFILDRKKVGFSSSLSNFKSKYQEYDFFQQQSLKELGWL